MRAGTFASEDEVGDLSFSVEDIMMFSSDSPPEDNNGLFYTACEEETTEDMDNEPSFYNFSDFK